MTDEKKHPHGVSKNVAPSWPPPERHDDETAIGKKSIPPQAVSMPHVDGGARIVLDMAPDGAVHMRAYCFGGLECSYTKTTDTWLLGVDLPCLLAELRLQLKLGRRCTTAESADIAADLRQGRSRPFVTT
ncbi:MAG: hypothetical protein ACRECD_14010 [Burkholderiaceae bacterium]